MYPIHDGRPLRLKAFRSGHIGRDHEFFDQTVAVEPRAGLDRGDMTILAD